MKKNNFKKIFCIFLISLLFMSVFIPVLSVSADDSTFNFDGESLVLNPNYVVELSYSLPASPSDEQLSQAFNYLGYVDLPDLWLQATRPFIDSSNALANGSPIVITRTYAPVVTYNIYFLNDLSHDVLYVPYTVGSVYESIALDSPSITFNSWLESNTTVNFVKVGSVLKFNVVDGAYNSADYDFNNSYGEFDFTTYNYVLSGEVELGSAFGMQYIEVTSGVYHLNYNFNNGGTTLMFNSTVGTNASNGVFNGWIRPYGTVIRIDSLPPANQLRFLLNNTSLVEYPDSFVAGYNYFDESFQRALESARQDGYKTGYDEGVNAGLNASDSAALGKNLISDTLNAPLNVLNSIVLFEAPDGTDITLGGIFTGLMALILVLIFLRVFAGG